MTSRQLNTKQKEIRKTKRQMKRQTKVRKFQMKLKLESRKEIRLFFHIRRFLPFVYDKVCPGHQHTGNFSWCVWSKLLAYAPFCCNIYKQPILDHICSNFQMILFQYGQMCWGDQNLVLSVCIQGDWASIFSLISPSDSGLSSSFFFLFHNFILFYFIQVTPLFQGVSCDLLTNL